MKYENKHLIISFTAGTILTLIIVWVISFGFSDGISVVNLGAECPACEPCKITAEKIIRDNPTIDLTKYNTGTKFKIPDLENMEIQIGKDVINKVQLDTLRIK